MAKLKGPLFSLGASQQIGKTLVFFPWKGLNVVREYVVPANPRSTGQTTQRGYLTTAVTQIHNEQARTPNGLDAVDISAYALLASVVKSATTWFNQLVKLIVDQLVAGNDWMIWRDGGLVAGAGQLTLTIFNTYSGALPTTCNIRFGTSKTALINTQATTSALLAAGVVIPGLVAGTKYYVQVRPQLPAGKIGANSGIYHGTPT